MLRSYTMNTSVMIITLVAICLTAATAAAEVQPGQNPWSQWKSMPQGNDFFPIGVWNQPPRHAAKYKALGIDYYLGMFRGPTAQMMAEMRKQQMPVICEFNDYAAANLIGEPLVWAWMHHDEPDLSMAYPRRKLMAPGGMEILRKHWPEVHQQLVSEGKTYTGWGMGANPVLDTLPDYRRMKKADPSRPVLLQLSKAAAFDGKVKGRGDHSGRIDLYPQYIAAADIVSFDHYPVARGDADKLWQVPYGLDNLRKWGAATKPVMAILEAGFGDTWATQAQQRAQAWMAINHGATSITWFCHRWHKVDGRKKIYSGSMPLKHPEIGAAIKAINAEIHSLAAVINSPAVTGAVTVASTNADVPVEVGVRTRGGAMYIFAVSMKTGKTTATFTVAGVADGATVEVINEDRSLTVTGGKFTDSFGEFDVNLYRIR